MTEPAVWFPAIRTDTGAAVFTERLAAALQNRGIRAEVAWLPHRAEYFPWSVEIAVPPEWANVVHVNSWLHSRFVPIHLPSVVTIHSAVHDPALSRFKTIMQSLYHQHWIYRLERLSIGTASAVTAVSAYAAKQGMTAFSCDDIQPIHNWIDTAIFSPPATRVQHQPFRLLFVGNVSKKLKGADLLAPIMKQLGAGFELRITGELSDVCSGEILPPNIVALGYIRDEAQLVAAYRECDALLFPTRLEGLSLASLEALSCGLPIIATNGSSMPEVVEHEASGLLCSQDNVDAFVAAARQLQNEKEKWFEMSLVARQRGKSFFSESAALEKYIALYRQLVQ